MIRKQTADLPNIFVKKKSREERRGNLSRSDMVRQRREEVNHKPPEKKAHHTVKTSLNAVPITMRYGTMGTPVIQRTRSGSRRQVSIPMGKPGTEVKMPSLPIIKPGWRLLSGFLFITLSIFLGLIATAPEFKISTVEVTGLNRINPQDFTTALRVSGKPIFLVDLEQVNTDITTLYSELTDVKVTVRFPATLVIAVQERQPYIEWHYNEMISWIDESGYIFSARGEAQPAFTIVSDSPPPLQPIPDLDQSEEESEATVTPEEPIENTEETSSQTNIVDPVLLEGVRILHERMPSLIVISYTKSDGFGWQDENNWNVYVGFDLNDLDQKLIVFQAIKQKLLEQGISPNLVNVAYVHAPFYRMEP